MSTPIKNQSWASVLDDPFESPSPPPRKKQTLNTSSSSPLNNETWTLVSRYLGVLQGLNGDLEKGIGILSGAAQENEHGKKFVETLQRQMSLSKQTLESLAVLLGSIKRVWEIPPE